MQSKNFESSCACGSVTVEIVGEPAIMAYCHCDTCRSWLGAPIHAAALWPSDHVNIKQGADLLDVYERTPASLRHFCKSCGAAVLIRHPQMGMTDIPAGSVKGLQHAPTIHVHYAERVMDVKDGLPKFAGMPAADGSGEQLAE